MRIVMHQLWVQVVHKVLLYPSLEKRGKGRFSKNILKIPLCSPLPKRDKKTVTEGLLRIASEIYLLSYQFE